MHLQHWIAGRGNLCVVIIAGLIGLAPLSAPAALKSWNGSLSGNWDTAGNWDPAGVPVDGDTLSFPALGGGAFLAMTNNIAGRRFESVNFNAGGYTLRGNALVVSNGFNSFNGAGVNTVFVNVTLGAAQTFNNSSPNFNLNGTVNLAGFDLTLDAGDVGDAINMNGAIVGTGDVIKLGTGIGRFEGPGANSFSGTTTVNAGELRLIKTNGVTAVPAGLIVNALARVTWFADDQVADTANVVLGQASTLDLNGHTDMIGTLAATSAAVDLGGGTLTMNGGIGVDGATTTILGPGVLNLGILSRTINVVGSATLNITANLTGSFRTVVDPLPVRVYAGFTKEGTGTLTLSGTNSYGGGTVVNAGRINANSDTAFGATSLLLTSPGTVTVNPGGFIVLNNADIGDKLLIVNRGVPQTALSASGVCSWSGRIVLNTNAILTGGTLALSNAISGTGRLELRGGLFRFAGTSGNTFDGDVLLSDGTLELAKTGGALAIPQDLAIGPLGIPSSTKTVRYLAGEQLEGDVFIYCRGTLDLNNNSDTVGNVLMAGGTVQTGSGTLTVNGNLNVSRQSSPCDANVINGRLAFGGAVPRSINIGIGTFSDEPPELTINAIIVSSPELFITGDSGQVVLNGANTFGGLLHLDSPFGNLIVRLKNPAALGATGAGTLLNGVGLELGGFNFAAEPLTNVNARTVIRTFDNNHHAGPIVLNADLLVTNTAATTEFAGAITGGGEMTKTGPGTLRFSGGVPNSFGPMFVNQGLFEMNKTPGGAATPLVVGDGVNAATARSFQSSQTDGVTVNHNSLWDLNGNNDAINPLVLDDGGDVTTGAGTLSFGSSGSITVTGGTLSIGDTVSGISGNLNLGATGTRIISVVERSSIIIGSDPTELIVSAVVSGAASLNKVGMGDMSLTAANTFTGNVTVSDGELRIAHNSALGTTAGTNTVIGDAELELSGNITVAGESLTLNTASLASGGALQSLSGTNTWTGPVAQPRNGYIDVATNSALILSGVISGVGGVIKRGPGRLEFAGAGANTYSNGTWVNEGTLELRKTVPRGAIPTDLLIGDGIGGALSDVVRVVGIAQIATTSDIIMASSGLLDLNDERETINSLSGGGRVDFGAAAAGGLVLNGNQSTEYSGQIIGAGVPPFALLKRGTGTFTLSGNNTYTGTNMVEAGTLLVNGSQPNSPVVVLNGATLGGNGRVGILDVNNLGNLAPGVSPGALISGPARLRSGSNFRVEVNGPAPISGYDQLAVFGALDLNGAQLLLTKGTDYAPVDGGELVIVSNDGADAVTGAFGGLAEGSVLSIGGTSFRISYAGGSGNDVTLTVTNIPLRFASARIEAGNGNGRVDPDECDHLFIALENRTGSTVAGLNARLDSLTPGVAVTQPDSAYPNIPPLGFGTNVMPFQIRVAPNFSCGENIDLALVITPSTPAKFTVPVVLNSGGPAAFSAFDSTNIPKAIPDLGTTNSVIIVGSGFFIGKARVTLHATHPAAGDLRFRLVSPNGTEVLLAANRGGNVANYGNSCAARTTFDDDAGTKITAATAPFTGMFAPEGSLAALIGESSSGTWRLFVDDTVAGDTGALQCWSLQLAPAVCGDGGGGCESCVASVSGTLVPGSPTLPERLSRTGVPSGCGNVKTCPGPTGGDPFRFRMHFFTNNGPAACVTVVLNVPCANSTNMLHSAAYLTTFNPADLCANYLGDSGASVFGGSAGYAFRVPAGARFVVVVHETNPTGPNQGCGNYTLQLYGLPCPPPALLIERVPTLPNRVRLHWSTAYPGFQLQRSTTLNGVPPFINVPGAPLVLDGEYNVTNSATANDDYFRLRKP